MRLSIVCAVLSLLTATCSQSDNNRSLSAEIAGKYCIKSVNGTYILAQSWLHDEVVLAPEKKDEPCDHWQIEDRGDNKVALKAASSDEYLSVYVSRSGRSDPVTGERTSFADSSVSLNEAWVSIYYFLWTPSKNEDGSWSFKMDANGEEWLGAQSDVVELHNKVGTSEHFWLEPKTDKNLRSSRKPFGSKSVSGKYCLKSMHDTFLRASKDGSNDEWKLEMVPPGDTCQYWNIEEHNGQVSIEANGTGKFLRANYDGTVDLVDGAPGDVLWSAFEHFDRSWSFKRERCCWLRAQAAGRVSSLDSDRSAEEQFRLVEWREPVTTTSTTVPPPITSTTSRHDDTSGESRNWPALVIVAASFSILLISALIFAIFCIHRSSTKMKADAANQLVVRENLVEKTDATA